MAIAEFGGDQQEAMDLVEAIANNCACEKDAHSVITKNCWLHEAMVKDQNFLNRILFARRNVAKLKREEHGEN